jgi:hypothetical protein
MVSAAVNGGEGSGAERVVVSSEVDCGRALENMPLSWQVRSVEWRAGVTLPSTM